MDTVTDDPFIALRKRIARGEQAQELLASPVLLSAMDAIERSALHTWRTSMGPAGLGARENAHATVIGIDAVRGQLRAWVDDGEIARDELEEGTDDNEPA